MQVQDAMIPSLAVWESFYVIVGSGGAALTGLQFVVMALVADSHRQASSDTIGAFGTPTIVHFCMVLFIASVLNAPWQGLMKPALILGLSGAGGIAYIGVITARALRQAEYKPVLEDWIWHQILPFIAYALLFAGGIGLIRYTNSCLFLVATTSLLLLFIGIHNAWDTVTYVAVEVKKQAPQ